MRYIELNTFLKIRNIVDTGGQAKVLIRSEQVKVNGQVETRLRKKLIPGDIVEFENKKLKVKESEAQMEKN